jgi:uncharacterized membrane protein
VIFGILVFGIGLAAAGYIAGLVAQSRDEVLEIKDEGRNGILLGLADLSVFTHVARVLQCLLFAVTGGVIIVFELLDDRPEWVVLLSRTVVLLNLGLVVLNALVVSRTRVRLARAERQRLAAEGQR